MAKAATADASMKADKPVKTAKPGKPAKPAKPNIFERLMQYFRDVRAEMRRVVWPNRPEVINSSVVVVTTLIFFTAFIALTDLVVRWFIFAIQRIGG